jgi:hypothetical protein
MGEVGIDEMADGLQIMGSLLPHFGHAVADPAEVARVARETFAAATSPSPAR